jgi:hypothetical protein
MRDAVVVMVECEMERGEERADVDEAIREPGSDDFETPRQRRAIDSSAADQFDLFFGQRVESRTCDLCSVSSSRTEGDELEHDIRIR